MKKRYLNWHQNCFILCSKILLNVLHNLSLTVLLPQQHTGFQTTPILKAFLATFGDPFSHCKWCPIYMIQQAYNQVSLSLWPCLTFFELKITYILKSSGWELEKSELLWEQNVLQPQVCFLQNYQSTKVQCSALQIGQDSSIYILDIILG